MLPQRGHKYTRGIIVTVTRHCNTAQRRLLLAITSAYKTTSTTALQILAGISSLDLELGRIARVEKGKAAVRREVLLADEAAIKEMQYNK